MTTAGKTRHTSRQPCPICSGADGFPRGVGTRCFGFTSGDWAHCTRQELASGLPQNPSSSTYAHRLVGECDCGVRHDPRPQPSSDGPRPQSSRTKAEVEAYDYRDEHGGLRYQVVRYKYDDNGDKTFQQRRPDDNCGWVWNLKGLRRVPYRLPDLQAALRDNPDVDVYMPEGERDVDRLWESGLVATCNSEGAGNFQQELVLYFDGVRIVLLQDVPLARGSGTS